MYFYYILQFVVHGTSVLLSIQISRTLCRLRRHLKRGARDSIRLFTSRRLVMLTSAAIYFSVSLTYAILYWKGMDRSDIGYVTDFILYSILHGFDWFGGGY